ncbi:MAG: hypothetical protein ACK2UW_09735 [Anaerolineales bacterium]|jgi:hypothetical protein
MRSWKDHKFFRWGGRALLLCVFLLVLLLTACTADDPAPATLPPPEVAVTPADAQTRSQVEPTATTADPTAASTVTPTQPATEASPLPPTATPRPPSPTPNYTPTPDTRPDPRTWRTWPVIPTVSARAVEIYQQGLASGSDPSTFSIIGDCQSEPPVFFGIYATDRYILPESEQYLQETIAHFQGNFDRQHTTVKNGLSVASVFSPLWAPKDVCQAGETPLECEFRLYQPSIVFINLGTNWKDGDGFSHAVRLREVIDFVIAHGALPILSTKGDNQEGDDSINLTTAELAYEYDIPLWNYWASIQYLPNHGLDKDRTDSNYLSVAAWDERSYTGLRVLDRVWRTVNDMEIP